MNDVFVITTAQQWLIHFAVSSLVAWPLIRIFRRAGLPVWPTIFVIVPVFGLAIVGSYLAFQRWPNIAPRVTPQATAQAINQDGLRWKISTISIFGICSALSRSG